MVSYIIGLISWLMTCFFALHNKINLFLIKKNKKIIIKKNVAVYI